ncbi:AtpZ/AtpI family protein [Guyparkeria sp. 1SP6A2]|nr:AtpZ/AtpI family protein [Guyparkeria sp. 1SP6A2]
MTDPDKTPDEKAHDPSRGGYLQARFKGLLHIGAGNMFASSIIAGLLMGYLLDVWLGTAPIFMLAVGALGFVSGMLNARKNLLATGRDDRDKDSDRP